MEEMLVTVIRLFFHLFLILPPVSQSTRECNDCLRVTLVLFGLLRWTPDHDGDDHDQDHDDNDYEDHNDHNGNHPDLYLVSGMLQEHGSAWQGISCSPSS